jgi:hypothetical protein
MKLSNVLLGLFLALSVGFLASALLSTPADVNNSPPIGGDSDAHGCKASAGYTWCESKQKCIRMWEEECMCAGIAGFTCPAGFICNISADYPDASGTCVAE